MRFVFFTAILFCLTNHSLWGEIKRVPGDFQTIQAAIDASADGDTILVSPGRYFENIRFKGKKIIAGSLFLTTRERSYIASTIIDGSNPAHADTASCVLFIDDEDSASVLEGFTLENGKGTKWIDEHGAGTYREGGAVLSARSSPVIRFNLIQNNEAVDVAGISSGGGGAIRCGDGAPEITNNVIINNKGLYGGGIVLNYCSGALVANNIVAYNEVISSSSPTYGGGGIWINNINTDANDRSPNLIYNNTITGNSVNDIPSAGYTGGGGILCSRGIVIVANNIIWDNTQRAGTEFSSLNGSTSQVSYNILNQQTGSNNINQNPMFADSLFYLIENSPAIDNGDPDPAFNDKATNNSAVFPSLGTQRNDIGAYGGPGGDFLVSFFFITGVTGNNIPFRNHLFQNYPNPFNPITTISYQIPQPEFVTLKVYDLQGREVAELVNKEKPAGNYEVEFDGSNLSSGVYFYKLETGAFNTAKKLLLLK